VVGDEGKRLLYDISGIGTSFTTFRTRRTGGWAYRANNDTRYYNLARSICLY